MNKSILKGTHNDVALEYLTSQNNRKIRKNLTFDLKVKLLFITK